jgi:hypothetical protein
MVLRRWDGSIFINSFARGGRTFELRFDARAIRRILDRTAPADAAETAITHILRGDLDAIETDALLKQAAQQSGVGVRPLQQTLKTRRAEQARQHQETAQAEARASRTDRRPRLPAPYADAPWIPQMDAYAAVLGAVAGPLPPSRHAKGEIDEAQQIPNLGLHAFSNANEEETKP